MKDLSSAKDIEEGVECTPDSLCAVTFDSSDAAVRNVEVMRAEPHVAEK